MPHGKLTVVVQSATGIKDPTLHGRGDSYCTLQCGSQVLSTHVAKEGSSHPVFHTEFEFEIDRSTNELAVSVYSKGTVRDDELIGYTLLEFKKVFFHQHIVPLTAYPLSRSSGKSGGYINISLNFKSRPSPYAQNAHAPVHHQHLAPPHAAPHHHQPQTMRNQHNPLRQSYPMGTEAGYENYEEGYGSSGSESSRSSRGSSKRSGGGSRSNYSRSQYEDYDKCTQEEYYYEEASAASYDHNNYPPPPPPQAHYNPRPNPNPRPPQLAPPRPNPNPRRPAVPGGPQVAISCRPRQPIPGGPQLNFANPYPQQPPPRVALYENTQVQVYQQRRPQPRPAQTQRQQQVMMPQCQQAMIPQQQQLGMIPQQQQLGMMPQQQVPSAGAQIAQAVAVGVAKAGVQAVVGGLLGGLFE